MRSSIMRSARLASGNYPAPDVPDQISLEETQHRARLFRLVNELPAEQRRVIAMRFAEQKSIREIARDLGRSDGAVKQLQFRGLQNLARPNRSGPWLSAVKRAPERRTQRSRGGDDG